MYFVYWLPYELIEYSSSKGLYDVVYDICMYNYKSVQKGDESKSAHYSSYRLTEKTNKNNINIKTKENINENIRQNVVFADNPMQTRFEIPAYDDATYKYGKNNDAELQDFFERPIQIADVDWNIGTDVHLVVDPWTDFFGNKRVINRVNNYNLLRAKLSIKIILNGTPFHYGMAIATYIPLPNYDDLSNVRTSVQQDIIAVSQRPHIFLNPTTSSGGVINCPFFWFQNWLNIPTSQWNQMGALHIRSLNILQHANQGTTSVNIKVFVSAYDVELSVPTSSDSSTLVNQSSDEYGKPIVSNMATSVASAMGLLKEAPVIGQYARATQMLATNIAHVAKAFGYSRPNVISDPVCQKPLLYGNLVNTDMCDTSCKLTLDTKQEISIDAKTAGVDFGDELEIKNIACRQSYLTTITWQPASVSPHLLGSFDVSPYLLDTYTGGELHFTPMAFAALPFKYWRGTIKYRFQIVCSSMHRGRLRVVYDPNGITSAQSLEYNTMFNRIIDISETNDFTIEVGWASSQPYLRTSIPGTTYTTFDLVNPKVIDKDYVNGTLNLYVVNQLVTPGITTNNIYINVYVSACDDIEFAVPHESEIESLHIFNNLQSGLETISENCPDYAPDLEPILSCAITDHYNDVFFGERIVSFRNCLKRYNYHSTIVVTNDGLTDNSTILFTTTDYPIHGGFCNFGIFPYSISPDLRRVNPVHVCLLTYLSPAFVAQRGGIRWKTRLNAVKAEDASETTVYRSDREHIMWEQLAYANEPSTLTQLAAMLTRITRIPIMWTGAAKTITKYGPALEYELPYYNNRRFSSARQVTFNNNNDNFTKSCHTIMFDTLKENSASLLDRYVSVAEDFTLIFFLSVPIMYRYNIPIPA